MIVKVLGLVFVFTTRFRFPKGKSIADIMKTRYGEAFLEKYANLERTTISYRNVIWI